MRPRGSNASAAIQQQRVIGTAEAINRLVGIADRKQSHTPIKERPFR
jgi:hypothetical protein